ncbi:hypothetical protein [Escherichia coli]|uniref:hypothetical protein n=1 Tax=Escherichia coli TaxID=562 RepID=UPI0038B3AE34
MSVTRFVTAPSDINKIKETHSDDELKRLLEAINKNCPTRIVFGRVEKGKGKETPLMASCLRTTPERISIEEFNEIKLILSEHK